MARQMDAILIQRFAAFTGAGTDVETQRSKPRIRVIVADRTLQAGHGPQMPGSRGGDVIEQGLANRAVSQSHRDESTICPVGMK